MTKKPFLPPPSGADAARAAVLATRFSHDAITGGDTEPDTDQRAPTVAQPAPVVERVAEPAAVQPAPVIAEPAAATSKSETRTPSGMARKTYYLSKATIGKLDQGVKSVRAALGPAGDRFAEWEIIAAIVDSGTAQPGAAADVLRQQLYHPAPVEVGP